MRLNLQPWILVLTAMVATSAQADLDALDPAVQKVSIAKANEMFAKRDVQGLMTLLKESHLFIKQDVALKLGRLGARVALEELRQLDRGYSDFECAPSGQFGVAVILIENPDTNSQKKALLAVVTEAEQDAKHAHSVVDAAGSELSRYHGDDIEGALASVYTYGAQYTVLAIQCRKLSSSDAIAKCIAVLERHENPLKAEAAQSLLVTFGKPAIEPVRELQARVQKKIKETDPRFTVPKTIVTRCERILNQIGNPDAANQGSARTDVPQRGSPSAQP